MLKQIKNFLYDISDIIITLIIIAVIVFSISMIMSSSIGVDFSAQFSDIEPNIAPQQTQTAPQEPAKVAEPAKDNVVTEPKATIPNDNTNSTASNPENTTNTPAPTESTQSTPSSQTSPQQNEEIVIEFNEGSYPSELAQAMQEKGVITDANAFTTLLIEEGLDIAIQPGKYTFKPGMTNEEASKVLVSE